MFYYVFNVCRLVRECVCIFMSDISNCRHFILLFFFCQYEQWFTSFIYLFLWDIFPNIFNAMPISLITIFLAVYIVVLFLFYSKIDFLNFVFFVGYSFISLTF